MSAEVATVEADAGEPQLVCTVTEGARVLGYVVIDSFVRGRSCGGLRMLPDIDEAEMRGLARAMTLKYGFLGIAQGGAKAGVRGDPEAPLEERRRRLGEFGRAIAPLLLSRTFVPGTDMGTDNADIAWLLAAAGRRVTPCDLRGTQSGYYTALSVTLSARQAAKHIGLELSGCRVAIEGLGRVGSPLATLLRAAGAWVVAVSTSHGAIYDPEGLDVERLVALGAQHGSRVVEAYPGAARLDRAALLELPVDILCPAARHDSVHADNADRIAARIICPGANNPVTPAAEDRLVARGVLCLPDFVTNSGGVLGGTMEFASMDRVRIASFMARHLVPRIAHVLDEAARRRVAPRQVAVELALRRSRAIRQRAARPSWLGRLFEAGLELYSRGWVPRSVVSALSPIYFRRILA